MVVNVCVCVCVCVCMGRRKKKTRGGVMLMEGRRRVDGQEEGGGKLHSVASVHAFDCIHTHTHTRTKAEKRERTDVCKCKG